MTDDYFDFFSGKGHEYSDLDRMMKKMEHWAHRLYPKLPFDDVMDRISVLGKKQAVKTYVKKIRQDMIVAPTSKEYIDDNEEGEDNTARYFVDKALFLLTKKQSTFQLGTTMMMPFQTRKSKETWRMTSVEYLDKAMMTSQAHRIHLQDPLQTRL